MGYRYILANKNGDKALWTGVFQTKEIALKWFAKWGDWHRKRGHELTLVYTDSTQ